MNKTNIVAALMTTAAFILASGCASNQAKTAAVKPAVSITPELGSVDVMHQGKMTTVIRNQDEDANVNPAYAKTSRKCPPFCIQPAQIAPGVQTIGEVEMLHYLTKLTEGDTSIIVIDSRTPDWVEKGTIPGARNIPWTDLNPTSGASPFDIADIMEKEFGAKNQEGLWDFSNARTLVMFCNGIWCGQSPANIKTLLKFGYPAERIKWYRGGMQSWSNLGLTVVTP